MIQFVEGVYNDKEEVVKEERQVKSDFSDDEWEHANVSADDAAPETRPISNSLGILAACYDSDEPYEPAEERLPEDCDGDDAPEEVKTVHIKEEYSEKVEADKERSLPSRRFEKRKRSRAGGYNECKVVCAEKKRELTLLEKLLHKEIRHERNVILQCVRYVVQNNFFV